MAAHGWRSGRSVIAWLRSEPFRFDFYQALRHLELLRPDAAPSVKRRTRAPRPWPSKRRSNRAFPASEISDLTSVGEGEDARRHHDVMTVTFMGLAGAMGPPAAAVLPSGSSSGYAPAISPPRDFLDIFNHRLISLMARMRRRHRPELVPQAPWQSPAARMLQALIGIETPRLAGAARRSRSQPLASCWIAGVVAPQSARSGNAAQRFPGSPRSRGALPGRLADSGFGRDHDAGTAEQPLGRFGRARGRGSGISRRGSN